MEPDTDDAQARNRPAAGRGQMFGGSPLALMRLTDGLYGPAWLVQATPDVLVSPGLVRPHPHSFYRDGSIQTAPPARPVRDRGPDEQRFRQKTREFRFDVTDPGSVEARSSVKIEEEAKNKRKAGEPPTDHDREPLENQRKEIFTKAEAQEKTVSKRQMDREKNEKKSETVANKNAKKMRERETAGKKNKKEKKEENVTTHRQRLLQKLTEDIKVFHKLGVRLPRGRSGDRKGS